MGNVFLVLIFVGFFYVVIKVAWWLTSEEKTLNGENNTVTKNIDSLQTNEGEISKEKVKTPDGKSNSTSEGSDQSQPIPQEYKETIEEQPSFYNEGLDKVYKITRLIIEGIIALTLVILTVQACGIKKHLDYGISIDVNGPIKVSGEVETSTYQDRIHRAMVPPHGS